MSGLFFKISQEVYATLITFICKNVFMSSFWGLFLANYKNPSLQYACETTVSEKAKYANKYFQGEKQALAGGGGCLEQELIDEYTQSLLYLWLIILSPTSTPKSGSS